MTSQRRLDLIMTLLLRHVSFGAGHFACRLSTLIQNALMNFAEIFSICQNLYNE